MPVTNQNQRTHFQGFAYDLDIVAGTDPTAAGASLVPLKVGYTAFITHFSMATTTDNAATLTLQDTASTAVVLAKTKASPGLGQQVWTWGEDGTPATVSKAVSVVASGAGLAGRCHVEGYLRQTINLTL